MRIIDSLPLILAGGHLLLRKAAASCSTFNASASFYQTTLPLADFNKVESLPPHVVQTSDVYTCTQGGSSFGGAPAPGVPFNCASTSECEFIVPHPGYSNVYGYTNLSSSVDAATTAQILDLLPDRPNGAAAPPQQACASLNAGSVLSFCVNHSASIYSVFVPTYTCIDGTLSGCDTGGSVANGTVVQICGIATSTNSGNPGTVLGYSASIQLSSAANAPHWAGATQCTPSAATNLRMNIFAISIPIVISAVFIVL